MSARTYRGYVELEGGKTITVDCDRTHKPSLEEASATIKSMIERLCSARSWLPKWDTLKIEDMDLVVRA